MTLRGSQVATLGSLEVGASNKGVGAERLCRPRFSLPAFAVNRVQWRNQALKGAPRSVKPPSAPLALSAQEGAPDAFVFRERCFATVVALPVRKGLQTCDGLVNPTPLGYGLRRSWSECLPRSTPWPVTRGRAERRATALASTCSPSCWLWLGWCFGPPSRSLSRSRVIPRSPCRPAWSPSQPGQPVIPLAGGPPTVPCLRCRRPRARARRPRPDDRRSLSPATRAFLEDVELCSAKRVVSCLPFRAGREGCCAHSSSTTSRSS